jgi:acyl-CoA reductase-like NAD-dependent aldehyde dehydrogenase
MELSEAKRRLEVREKSFVIINPATGQKVAEYPHMDAAEVDAAVKEAREAFHQWSKTSFAQRKEVFTRAASLLAERCGRYAASISAETGKTQLDAVLAEIIPTCDLLHYYAKNAQRFLRPVKVEGTLLLPGRKGFYTFEPRGVIGVIAPWNYPFTLASGPVISALAAGNAVVLKPASQTTGSGVILKEVLVEAGVPSGAIQVVTGSGSVTGRALVEHPDINMLFFTGSTEVGVDVNVAAAKNLVPAVMELGGKDVMIVTRKADLDRAAHAAVWGAFFNSGQTCTGVEFCLVERPVFQQFLDKVLSIASRIESGTSNGRIGAMTMESQVRILEEQVADAVAKGATVHLGGRRREAAEGLFFAPTVITGIKPHMKMWQEETFGPILPVLAFDTPEEAIRMANSTPYGLSGSVFSRDMAEARFYADRMETGSVNINDCLVTFAFPSLPFGGVKRSGVGYYHGEIGIRNFCKIKSVTEFKGWYSKEFFHYPLPDGLQEAVEAALLLLYGKGFSSRLEALAKAARSARSLLWRKK